MSTCNHDCSSCSEKCSTQNGRNLEFMEPLNKFSNIKHVIGVMSGKGGVGKSSVTSVLAVHMQRLGYKVGVLDSDITGPSIPKAFGIKQKAIGYKTHIAMTEDRIITAATVTSGKKNDGKQLKALVEKSKATGIQIEDIIGD